MGQIMELHEKTREQIIFILNDAKDANVLLESGRVIDCHRKLQAIRTRLLNLLQKGKEDGVHQTQCSS